MTSEPTRQLEADDEQLVPLGRAREDLAPTEEPDETSRAPSPDASPPPSQRVPRRASEAARNGAAHLAQAPAPAAAPLDRDDLHRVPIGLFGRLAAWGTRKLKSEAEEKEERVNRALAADPVLTGPNLVAFVSPKGGPGKSTLTTTTGDAIARYVRNLRVLAIDFNPGGGVLSLIAPDNRRASQSLLELYEARETITSPAQIKPFVSSLPSGLDILAVPPKPSLARQITPAHYEALLDDVLLRFGYHLVLLDTSPDTTNPVTQYALERAQQMVLIGEQNYFTAELVNEAVEDLLESHAGQQTTVVLNRVESDPGAGDIEQVQAKLRARTDGPQVVIPHDKQLARSLAAGRYHLDAVARPTRLPLKHLALHIVERLV